jgi:hypothetical protein
MNTYLKEITEWDSNVSNHTYIVNKKTELVGYIKSGTKEEIIFKSPMKQFSKARRKFVQIKS